MVIGRQDDATQTIVRESSTSLASSMEEDWCLSTSTDGLECSEDIPCEDAEMVENACEHCSCQEHELSGSTSFSKQPSTRPALHVEPLIRADLASQQEIYHANKKLLIQRELRAQAQQPGSSCPHTPAGPRSDPWRAAALGRSDGGGITATSAERLYGGWLESSLSDRRLLVGWMMDLTVAAGFQRETLHLAVSLLDRFLAASCGTPSAPPERLLQLLAMACVSVAMKFEEVVPLHSADIVRLAVDPLTGAPMYRVSDLGQMEWRLLWLVDWRARVPNSLTFLQHFLHCCIFESDIEAAESRTRTAVVASTLTPSDVGNRAADQHDAGEGRAGGCGNPGSPGPHRGAAARESLESWAYRFLDIALLHHCDLVHCYSTVALACLSLAEHAVAASAATAGLGKRSSVSYRSAFAGSAESPWGTTLGPCVITVQMATGLPLEQVAPNLQSCLALLKHAMVLDQQQQKRLQQL